MLNILIWKIDFRKEENTKDDIQKFGLRLGKINIIIFI